MQRQVYVMQNDIGLVKIGVSNNPMVRARQITNSSGIKTNVLNIYDTMGIDAFIIEKELHKLFKCDRRHGEWFNGEILDVLSSVIVGLIHERSGNSPVIRLKPRELSQPKKTKKLSAADIKYIIEYVLDNGGDVTGLCDIYSIDRCELLDYIAETFKNHPSLTHRRNFKVGDRLNSTTAPMIVYFVEGFEYTDRGVIAFVNRDGGGGNIFTVDELNGMVMSGSYKLASHAISNEVKRVCFCAGLV